MFSGDPRRPTNSDEFGEKFGPDSVITNSVFYFSIAILAFLYARVIPIPELKAIPLGANFDLSLTTLIQAALGSAALIGFNERVLIPLLSASVSEGAMMQAEKVLESSGEKEWGREVTREVMIAVTEELFFRGVIQGVLEGILGGVESVLFSSIIFAVFHAEGGLVYILGNLVLGLFLGLSYIVSHNLVVPILLHAIFNLRVRYLARDSN